MSDSLVVGGTTYTGVTGFKATDTSENTLTYVRPQGSLSITNNGNNIDVTQYAAVNVSVSGGGGTLITKSIVANGTYNASSDNADGYSSVTVTVPDAYTLTDVSNTTGTTAQITAGNGGGGGATQHEIHLEFSDSTDMDIDVYYDDSLIGTMITAYSPATWTYSNKTVVLAELDDVAWYDKTGTWETLWDDDTGFFEESGGDYPYCWITDLGSTPIVVGDEYRVTFKNVAYRVTAYSNSGYRVMGNPKYVGQTDDGSGVPFLIVDYTNYGAWTGNFDLVNTTQTEHIKIEHLVTS